MTSQKRGPGLAPVVRRRYNQKLTIEPRPRMQKQSSALLVPLLVVAMACQNSGDQTLARNPSHLDALYAPYTVLRGDLHMHSSTASFDSSACGPECQTFTAAEQFAAAREVGLDFAALTEHDRNPNQPGSRMTETQWSAALEAVASASSPEFLALAGYEWTSSQLSCFETHPQHPDFNHKVVILPPGASKRCDSDVCVTPDQLGEFVHSAGGVILTPHPWRVSLLESGRADLPAFVTRSYFDYAADGPGGVFVGAEVSPDFQPLRWKVLCAYPDEDFNSQTGTLAEWRQALVRGKRLAAVATSDRHFGFTPFGSRSTVLFASAKTPEAILEALKARRAMAANLEPFAVRLAIGGAIIGETAKADSEGMLRVSAPQEQIAAIEVWRGDRLLQTFPPNAVNQDLVFAPDGVPCCEPDSEPGPASGAAPVPGAASSASISQPASPRSAGPVWVKVTGVETDPATGTPRTTITSPIWLE